MKKLLLVTVFTAMTCHASNAEVGFSPEGSARDVVLSAIGGAQRSIHMMAYSFTAPDIVRALADAHKRGVDVLVVVDENGNQTRPSIAAMNYAVNNGISLRTDANYKIQHDKVMIIDGDTVETGSFNYTASAEKYNSENALVLSGVPELAKRYDAHWLDRWNQGTEYRPSY
ncbi:phospholipase D family protein [Pantoea agglomerans]|uniref:phospholipase D family nuclease n=1 Tax=Enterobacter agglomerans TaxID=549 RepID=UPI001F4EEE38|nr:phospholipase D family protein [Pantoea agglomerans]MCH9408653.1 phospholipase D family protein [Pantoea agglomerans]